MLHNENCNRDVKLKSDGTPLVVVQRSKATKQVPTAVHRRQDATYSKISRLATDKKMFIPNGVFFSMLS